MLKNDRSFSAAILQTIGVALLAIDRDLKVFVANDAFLRQFKVRREDTVGYRLFDLGNRQWDIPELRRLLDKAFQHDGLIENYRVEHTFESIGCRVMLLNARRIQTPEAGEGLLLAIADDTERDRLQFELEGRIEFADKLIDSVREALLILHWDLRVHSANQPFYDLFKVERDKTVGRLVYELGNGQWDIPELRVLLEDILPKAEAFDDYEVRHTFEAIGDRVMLLNGRRLDHLDLIVLAIRDVTGQRALEKIRQERDRRREFTLVLSQTLAALSDAREIQATACRLLGQILGVASAQYSVLDLARQRIIVAHEGYRQDMPSLVGEYPIADYPAHVAALQAGRPLVIDDVETTPLLSAHERAGLVGLSIRAALTVPWTRHKPASAIMGVFSPTRRAWSEDDIALVQETADRTWVALERARADTEVRERERKLVSLVDGVPAAIALTDAEGTVTLGNAAFKALVPAVIPSRDKERVSLWRSWDAEGRPLTPTEYPGARALRGEKVLPGIEMLYGSGTDAAWKYVTAVPIRDDRGRVVGTVAAIIDIDTLKRSQQALRESEERFRQFGAASSDVLWIRNVETLRWEYLSPGFEAIYGVRVETVKESEGLGSWLDFIVPEDRKHAEASIGRVCAGEQVSFEYRIRRPDGQVRWIRDTDFPMRRAVGALDRIGGIGQDVTEQKSVSHRMEIMVAELQHRTRNLIAVIRSIARQTMSHTGATSEFREEFDHRLAALARVQGLLSRSDEEPITIGALVRMELEALGLPDDNAARVTLSGPPVRLRSTIVQTLALALHELATNARKYGALSRDDGHLDVRWQVRKREGRGASLHLEWSERAVGIAAGETPQRRGYGRELIEQALPYSLGADVTYELGPEGVRCVIDLPLDKGKKPG